MVFFRWRVNDALKKSQMKLNTAELVGSNILLIVGGLVLGYGLGRVDVIGFALAVVGGVMLFAGIVLTVRTLIDVANALANAAKAVEKVTDYVEDIEEKTFGSNESKYNRYNNLQQQVAKLQKDVKYLAGVLRQKGFSIYGM